MKIKKYKVFTLFVLALLMASLVFVRVSVELPFDVAYIEPPIIYTNVSENFTVTVVANVTFEIYLFMLQLNFDPTQMSVVNVTFVPPWGAGAIDVGVGNVSVVGFSIPIGPGSIPLVEITFHCDASGISDLWFDYVEVFDLLGTIYDLPWQGAIVQQGQFFFKAPYEDYAPSGIPDFDQRQDAWWPFWYPAFNWSWCAPTAVANSLWWYDSSYETNTIPPPTQIDNFPLVGNYGPWDDHDPLNVQPFIEHLAYLMDTDGQRTWIQHPTTYVIDMETGLAQYLSWTGVNPQGDVNGDGIVDQTDWNIVNASLGSYVVVPDGSGEPVGPWNMAADIYPVTTGWPNRIPTDNVVNASDLALVTANMNSTGMFYEHTVPMPDFFLIEEEVERSQDVVIILGFYIETGPGEYYRVDETYPYGHAVTVAGVNSTTMQIAISDPAVDAFELGLTPGRSPVPHPHMPPEPPYTTHNNASLVSHDIYNVTFNPVMGMWELLGYAGYPTPPWHVLIENAVITSSLGVHDVAVIDVFSQYPQVDQGQVDPINVTVENQGDFPETIDVYAFYDGNLSAPKQTIPLNPGQNVTLTFNWNTTGVQLGNYTISANATIPIDDDPTDNIRVAVYTQEVIPEFPPAMVLPLFMVLSLITVVFVKLKKKKQ